MHELSDRRLLIIEDDPLSREILVLLAADAGFVVEAHESGEDALSALSATSTPPHAILADMQMKGICGNPLGLKLRAACGSTTLILAMSAASVPASGFAEFDAFLLKPFSMHQVTAALNKFERPKPKSPALQPSESSAPMLSPKTYASLAESMSPEQLRRLYAMCLDDADVRIHKMRQASAARDPVAWHRAAHSIKGGCGMVGALELARLATEMETQGLPDDDNVAPLSHFLDASARLRRMLSSR